MFKIGFDSSFFYFFQLTNNNGILFEWGFEW